MKKTDLITHFLQRAWPGGVRAFQAPVNEQGAHTPVQGSRALADASSRGVQHFEDSQYFELDLDWPSIACRDPSKEQVYL